MEIIIRQAPMEGFTLDTGYPWFWAVLGDDERVPYANGRAKTEVIAYALALLAMQRPSPKKSRIFSAVYPVPAGWRWCVWRGEYQTRPVYGGRAASALDADRMVFYAVNHTYRPWGDYDRPYSNDFAGGELLDPLAKAVARV